MRKLGRVLAALGAATLTAVASAAVATAAEPPTAPTVRDGAAVDSPRYGGTIRAQGNLRSERRLSAPATDGVLKGKTYSVDCVSLGEGGDWFHFRAGEAGRAGWFPANNVSIDATPPECT